MKKRGCGCCVTAFLTLCIVVCVAAFIYENTFGKNAPTSTQSTNYSQNTSDNDSKKYGISEPSSSSDNGNLTYYTEANDFSEGLAWVQISEFSDTGVWLNSQNACINKVGEIIYSTPQSTEWIDHIADFEPTPFVNGVSIVDENTLINNKGEFVWTVDNNGWSYADKKFGKGTAKSIKLYDGGNFTGYAFVRFFVDSYNETANYCGVLNPDGSWRMEPFLVKDEVSFAYDGLYGYRTTDETGYFNSSGLYDCNNNTFIKDIDLTDTEVSNKLSSRQKKYNFSLHNNMMYNSEKKVFEDFAGNTVIDLSEYYEIDAKIDSGTGYYSSPSFNNGYCVLNVRNKQRQKYMTVINTSGEQLFEPIRCSRYENTVSDGLLLAENDDGEDVYLNMRGEVVIKPDGSGKSFSDGYAVISKKYDAADMYIYNYIDTEGNTVLK